MRKTIKHNNHHNKHRGVITVLLCFFAICLIASQRPAGKRLAEPEDDKRVHLLHADELEFDNYGPVPDAQKLRGNVQFKQEGMLMWCDSAYFFEQENTFEAFGHVRFKQGDTLSLTCDWANYEGSDQMMMARHNVVLRHNKQTLYTDSLNYDRMYGQAYFFEGGQLIDGTDSLTSDWGRYDTNTKEAVFYYNVRMKSDNSLILGDTLYYDTQASLAHITGPSVIYSDSNIVHTTNAYFDSDADFAQLFERSKIINGGKTIIGDTLYHNGKTSENEGFGNVIYTDTVNKNSLIADYVFYNDSIGYGLATKNAVLKDFSQGDDTLYAHADTLKLFTFNIDSDSVYRLMHAYKHVRAFRTDIQAMCDSMVIDSRDSCLTMYQDPIAWNYNRQLLGEEIKVFMNDSTIRLAQVIGQALSIEQYDTLKHYNQLASKLLEAFFIDGQLERTIATGNVMSVFYPYDDKDSTLTGLNYLETDTMRMFFTPERKLKQIKTTKATATIYPMSQIPPDKPYLPNFMWFDDLRPKHKDDIFIWRPKPDDKKLRPSMNSVKKNSIPHQTATSQLQ